MAVSAAVTRQTDHGGSETAESRRAAADPGGQRGRRRRRREQRRGREAAGQELRVREELRREVRVGEGGGARAFRSYLLG